jgi:hypothetical protein
MNLRTPVKAKNVDASLSESSSEEPVSIQDEYSRLNEKCDVVIKKIKSRKSKKQNNK